MSDYNGWTNYATWRVNLEIFDGMEYREWFSGKDAYDLSEQLKTYTEDLLEEISEGTLALDYALAFLTDVNWYEIAEHMIDEYSEEEAA